MKSKSSSFSERVLELESAAFFEFNNLADYVWKSPRLLEHETALEQKKLARYFPDDSKTAEMRWKHESHKLTRVFPYLIAVGNLYSATSLFESYMLLLADILQDRSGVQIDTARGLGITKFFSYFKSQGLRPSHIPLFEQVSAGIRIRNCFAHASGMLAWSRNEKELRRLQSGGVYLSLDHRKRRISLGGRFDDILITNTPLGGKLQISNNYPHVVTNYFREYFSELCKAVEDKFIANP
jgi:hypothetical protein